MRLFGILIIFIFSSSVSWAQCAEMTHVKLGGDFKNTDFMDPCPTYTFEYDADSSQPWKGEGNAFSSRSYETELDAAKNDLETILKGRIGADYLDKMKLHAIAVSAYDSIPKLKGRYPVVDMYKCKTKYFFYYYLNPAPQVSYCVGIAVDDYFQILSDLPFPDKEGSVSALDGSINVCKAVEIAKGTGTPITPIDAVFLDFDYERKTYVWVVRQQIQNPYGNHFEFNEVVIEAYDGTQTTSFKKTVNR